jgi:hypothetical protein
MAASGGGGFGGGGGDRIASAETCDGTDEDCDGIADDGASHYCRSSDDLFLAGIYRDSIDGAVFDADGNST